MEISADTMFTIMCGMISGAVVAWIAVSQRLTKLETKINILAQALIANDCQLLKNLATGQFES